MARLGPPARMIGDGLRHVHNDVVCDVSYAGLVMRGDVLGLERRRRRRAEVLRRGRLLVITAVTKGSPLRLLVPRQTERRAPKPAGRKTDPHRDPHCFLRLRSIKEGRTDEFLTAERAISPDRASQWRGHLTRFFCSHRDARPRFQIVLHSPHPGRPNGLD